MKKLKKFKLNELTVLKYFIGTFLLLAIIEACFGQWMGVLQCCNYALLWLLIHSYAKRLKCAQEVIGKQWEFISLIRKAVEEVEESKDESKEQKTENE